MKEEKLYPSLDEDFCLPCSMTDMVDKAETMDKYLTEHCINDKMYIFKM